jgi:hypothetical protein
MTESKNESVLISPEDSARMVEPKRSCKHCYGRGYITLLKGDGYIHSDKEGHTPSCAVCKVPNPDRVTRPCACVFRKNPPIVRRMKPVEEVPSVSSAIILKK